MSAPSSLDLQIVSTVRNRLSENRCEMHDDGKNVSSKKLQIKTNPDDVTDNMLKYTASIN